MGDRANIIGLTEIVRSFMYKITGDAQPQSGMGKFETKEVFASMKASCQVADAEAVGAWLYGQCERDVMAAAHYHANFLAQPPEPQVQTQTQTPTPEKYVVAEKPPEKQPETAPPAPEPAPVQRQVKKDPPPSKAVADRLKAKGMTVDDLKTCARFYFNPPLTGTPTQDQYVEAFNAAEKYLETHTLDQLRAELAKKAGPASNASNGTLTPAQQISARWPSWSPELTRVGALWCRDHVKDAGALEAFLIAAGINATTPPGKIEAFLAISRHLAISSAPALIEYAKKANDPLSLIEEQLSKIVGQPIRFADNLGDSVGNAFTQLRQGAVKGAAGK